LIKNYGRNNYHDVQHKHGELAMVAATLAVMHTNARVVCPHEEWGSGNNPWNLEEKLLGDQIHTLKVAGALIAAEIDRLNSLAPDGDKDNH